jgi:hypothetical protein
MSYYYQVLLGEGERTLRIENADNKSADKVARHFGKAPGQPDDMQISPDLPWR